MINVPSIGAIKKSTNFASKVRQDFLINIYWSGVPDSVIKLSKA
jgi:hypothetical protein